MTLKHLALAATALLCLTKAGFAADAAKPPEWSAAVANPVTKDVKAACESKDVQALSYCQGILMGLYDSNFYLSDLTQSHGLCIPPQTTGEQMRKAFVDYTNKRPDDLLGPISVFYYLSMDNAFPCPTFDTPQPTKTKK